MKELTVPEAARTLKVRMNYVRVLLAEGMLIGRKDEKGRWRIEDESVELYRLYHLRVDRRSGNET